MQTQVYVIMRNDEPRFVEFELLAAMKHIPGIHSDGCDLRRLPRGTYVAEYREPHPYSWRIVPVGTPAFEAAD